MNDRHILQNFQQALDQLQVDFEAVGNETLLQWQYLRTGLFEFRRELVERVLAENRPLRAHASELVATCSAVRVKYHPVARDLALVLSVDHAARHLERTAHQCSVVAKNTLRLLQLGEKPALLSMRQLYHLAENELADALLAIRTRDAVLADAVRRRDRELDTRFLEEMENVVREMTSSENSVQTRISLVFILRAIERVGDHAKGMLAPLRSAAEKGDDLPEDDVPSASGGEREDAAE